MGPGPMGLDLFYNTKTYLHMYIHNICMYVYPPTPYRELCISWTQFWKFSDTPQVFPNTLPLPCYSNQLLGIPTTYKRSAAHV